MPFVKLPTGQSTRYYRSDTGHVNDSQPIIYVNLSPENAKTFVRNPNWKVLLAKGADVTAPYTRREFTSRCKSASISGQARYMPGKLSIGTHHWAESSGTCIVLPSFSISANLNDSVLKDKAVAGLKRKLAGQTKQMNSLVPIVELRELRKLIGGIAQLTEPLVGTLLKIQSKKPSSSSASQASNAWLQWSFGVSPLIGEAKTLSDSLSDFYLGTPRTLRLTGTARKTWVSGSGQLTTTGIFGTMLKYNTELVHELSYRVIAGVNVTLRSDPNYGLLSDHLGMNIQNLASAAWELTSYSWLVDYFSTMGDFLDDAFSRSTGWNTKYVVMDKLYRVSGRTHGKFVPSGAQFVTSSCKDGIIDYFEFSREKLGSIPARQLRFKETDEISRNAVNRLLNLTALLGSRIK